MDEQTRKAATDLAAGNPAISGTVLALVDAVGRLVDENARLTEEVERLSGRRLVDGEPVYNARDAEPQASETIDAPVAEDIPDAVYARLVHEGAALPSGRADTAADYWAEVSW